MEAVGVVTQSSLGSDRAFFVVSIADYIALMNPANLFDQDADALQLAPGDFLFREGDKCDEMYVLLEGKWTSCLAIMWSRPQGQAR